MKQRLGSYSPMDGPVVIFHLAHVLGVALLGPFVAKEGTFVFGTRESLIVCAALLLGAAVTIMVGARSKS
ncbi:hypothetical protein [Rhodanobacter sp. OK091]|uniref:hypothetical protein n=1 Tax=Rhodanobacter sp. OK091 TaxID=1881037 RepID=UPI001160634A|nr:hypothetical protein [Rhodanobacter sp. OK091]